MVGILPKHDPHNYWVKYQNPDSKQLRSFWEQHGAETIGLITSDKSLFDKCVEFYIVYFVN